MLKHYKLKAFTLLELITAMIISGLLISMALSIYLLSEKQMNQFSEGLDRNYQIQQLNEVLKRDIITAHFLTTSSSTIILSPRSNAEQAVYYKLQGNAIIREKEGLKDRFELDGTSKEAFFEQQPVFSSTELADHLQLSLEVNDQEYSFNYYKDYSAEELLEWEAKYER